MTTGLHRHTHICEPAKDTHTYSHRHKCVQKHIYFTLCTQTQTIKNNIDLPDRQNVVIGGAGDGVAAVLLLLLVVVVAMEDNILSKQLLYFVQLHQVSCSKSLVVISLWCKEMDDGTEND